MNAIAAEFTGTFILLLLGNGVVANVVLKNTFGHNGGWIAITTGWALAVFAGVVVAAPYSGAHLNPAVSIGLAVAGQFSWQLVPLYLFAQFSGAMGGALVVWILYRDHFAETTEPALKRAAFCTSPAIYRISANLFSEIIGGFVLLFVIFHFTGAAILPETPVGLGSIGAIPVTLLVWSIGLSLGGTTGYAINPARDLSPRILHAVLPIQGKGSSEWSYAWIPVAGPLIGAVLAGLVYLLIK